MQPLPLADLGGYSHSIHPIGDENPEGHRVVGDKGYMMCWLEHNATVYLKEKNDHNEERPQRRNLELIYKKKLEQRKRYLLLYISDQITLLFFLLCRCLYLSMS